MSLNDKLGIALAPAVQGHVTKRMDELTLAKR